MNRHRTDLFSFVSGLLFVGLGVLALAGRLDASVLQLRWVGSALLIVLGFVLVLSVGFRTRPDARPAPGAPDGPIAARSATSGEGVFESPTPAYAERRDNDEDEGKPRESRP